MFSQQQQKRRFLTSSTTTTTTRGGGGGGQGYGGQRTHPQTITARRYQRLAKLVTRLGTFVVLAHVLFLFMYASYFRQRHKHHLHSNIPDLLKDDEVFTTSARRLRCKLTHADRSGRGFQDNQNRPFDPMPSGSVMPFSGAFGSIGLERDMSTDTERGLGLGGGVFNNNNNNNNNNNGISRSTYNSHNNNNNNNNGTTTDGDLGSHRAIDTGLNATIDALIGQTLGSMEGISSSVRTSSSKKKKAWRNNKKYKDALDVDMKVVSTDTTSASAAESIYLSDNNGDSINNSKNNNIKNALFSGNENIPSVAQYASRVFILTGVSAWQNNAAELAEHFLLHYVTKHDIPARHVLCIIQARSNNVDTELVKQIQDVFLRYGAYTDIYEGDALLYSIAAARFEEKLSLSVDEDDWVVAVDLDEHVDAPHDESIARFLARADALGFNLVNGKWIDRIAEDGNLKSVSLTQSIDVQFPRKCYIGPQCDVRTNPTHRIFTNDTPKAAMARFHDKISNTVSSARRRMRMLLADSKYKSESEPRNNNNNNNNKARKRTVPRALLNVIAHKVSFPVLDVRVLHDFAIDDVISASLPSMNHETVYPVPLKVQHYQWHDQAHKQMKMAAAGFERCDQLKYGAAQVAKQLAKLLSSYWRHKLGSRKFGKHDFLDNDVDSSETNNNNNNNNRNLPANSMLHIVCPELVCGLESKVIRRVAVVTSVWEHVDGVSRTMKRVAEHLRERDDSEIMVVSPDLAKEDYQGNQREDDIENEEGELVDPSDRERILVAPVPHVAVPGRAEYKMSAPLQTAQKTILDAFDPTVIHVAAPDVLGHSAVEWARKRGACSVCSYHTAFDTYLQYYHAKLLVRPIRQMLSQFYRSCDVVATPSFAAAEHLEKMGVPFTKMGFFPRGVNDKMYNPNMRDKQYRIDKFQINPAEEQNTLVILWVARIVREKGLASFCRTIRELGSSTTSDLPPFKVVVAGDGPDLPWVRSELKNVENVLILGHSGGLTLSKTYAAGDIFFFPSRTEVIPNNIIEAMASGLPVVTDDVGVNRAIVDDGNTGILVQTTTSEPTSSNIKNYVNAIESLMLDNVKRKQMGANAHQSTVGLTWDRTFRSLRHIYDRCRPGLPYSREGDDDDKEEEEDNENEANDDVNDDVNDQNEESEHHHQEKEANEEDKKHSSSSASSKKKKKYERDVLVDADAPKSSLIYRISKGMHGGYARSKEAAANDDKEDEIERLHALQAAAGFAAHVDVHLDEVDSTTSTATNALI
jgi:phosphatidylinositol alpha 1,6-mannosyltransferase